MRHPESELQIACKKWFGLQYPKWNDLLIAIPNGGARSKVEAAIMKAEGVTPGVCDMMLAIPLHGWPGAFIELKIGSNTQSPAQKQWSNLAASVGYATALVYTLDEFMEFVNNYMNDISIINIETVVCKHYGIAARLIHAKTQKREITEPRQVCMTLIRQKFGSYTKSALYFSKDHATCIHAKRTVINLYDTSPVFRTRMKRILSDLLLDESILRRK